MPVSVFLTATFAPGTDVPAGSDTRPVICPVCANAMPVKPTIISMRCTTHLLSDLSMFGYSHSCQQIITLWRTPHLTGSTASGGPLLILKQRVRPLVGERAAERLRQHRSRCGVYSN